MLTDHDRARLVRVHPVLIAAIDDIFGRMASAGTPMFVCSGVRTTEQQQALYAQGRTTPGHIVTEKDGVTNKSDHQVEAEGFGHAVDCAFLPTKDQPDPWHQTWPWKQFGQDVVDAGMKWGGTWKMPADLDHVQYVSLETGE